MKNVEATSASPATSIISGMTRPVLMSAAFFMVVTGILYPLATTATAQLLFRRPAQGNLIAKDGQLVGSRLIGQYFTQPQYFHGRPSATSGPNPDDRSRMIDQPYNAAASTASNQGVLSRKLLAAVAERARIYREQNGLAPDAQVPVDAVTASASGLDPHISRANARLQTIRVAAARGMPEQEVAALVERNTTQRQFGILGEPAVHVLELNLALDDAVAARPAAQ
ncbi:potassium-transporting ATPase subunit KdpC [Nitrosovibrio sp. Nv17]|uniref:potassium-transporting ATPase subunit KdpC n=1 Tax=Nitrosovibrio sp. Nv17 TaxID=1855339 RepID=UPI000908618A|nr:potassium-transporting ATPase subunit KdpC [Nitrosovibrio sp. Nv17]SFW18255.1 K+-transporting ATPase ATPase C chain [Nitrosovibrio sp. Nv17]